MKLIRCDGRELEVREVGDKVIYRLRAGTYPLKAHGWSIMDDDSGRDLLRGLLQAGAESVPIDP